MTTAAQETTQGASLERATRLGQRFSSLNIVVSSFVPKRKAACTLDSRRRVVYVPVVDAPIECYRIGDTLYMRPEDAEAVKRQLAGGPLCGLAPVQET